MKSVVAFEGSLDEAYHATWGTAALRVGDELVNPTTGFRGPIQLLHELSESGSLFTFSRPIRLPDDTPETALILIAINSESPFVKTLTVEKGRHGGLLKCARRDGAICSVVRDTDALRLYTKDVAHKVIGTVLAEKRASETLVAHVSAGLALDPSHPFLNALRVYLAPNSNEGLEALTRSCTRGAKGRETFDEFLRALNNDGQTHILSYRDGITAGGGIDVGYAIEILGYLKTVIKELGKDVRDNFPFLPRSPLPRISAMSSGSASLQFVADIKEATLGERVARYLELRALERALQGDSPGDLADDIKFEKALEGVARPTPETSLFQKPLNKETEEPVTIDTLPEGDVEDEPLSLVGFVTGVLSEAGKIEVRVFPGIRGRLLLSATDSGVGEKPDGVGLFADAGHIDLYTLVSLDLLRRTDSSGRERTFLQGVQPFKDGCHTILCVPSSVVRGTYRLTQPIVATRQLSRLHIGNVEIPVDLVPKKASTYAWLQAYRKICEDIELTDSRMEWTRPARAPKPPSLTRVLVALHELGGCAYATDLAEEVSRRFGQIARVNNTRREVHRHSELMHFQDDDRKIVSISDRGRLFVKTYMLAAGDVGEAS